MVDICQGYALVRRTELSIWRCEKAFSKGTVVCTASNNSIGACVAKFFRDNQLITMLVSGPR